VHHAIVVVGGSPPEAAALARLDPATIVVAADSGYDHARGLGLTVDVLVGDLDSITPEGLAAARAAGVLVQQHDPDKDATDTELALTTALAGGATHITVVTGPIGDRLDHSLAVLLGLGHPRFAGVTVDAWFGTAAVHVVRGPGLRTLTVRPGEVVTLLPVGGAASGITTTGLLYPLHAEALAAASSRGVSNVATEPDPTITVQAGCLLVIRPEALP